MRHRTVIHVSCNLMAHVQLPGILFKGVIELGQLCRALKRDASRGEIRLFGELIEIEPITQEHQSQLLIRVVIPPSIEQFVFQYFLKSAGLHSMFLADRYLDQHSQMRNVKIDRNMIRLDRDVKHLTTSDGLRRYFIYIDKGKTVQGIQSYARKFLMTLVR